MDGQFDETPGVGLEIFKQVVICFIIYACAMVIIFFVAAFLSTDDDKMLGVVFGGAAIVTVLYVIARPIYKIMPFAKERQKRKEEDEKQRSVWKAEREKAAHKQGIFPTAYDRPYPEEKYCLGEVLSGPYAGCKIVNGFYLRIPATLPHTVGSWYYNKFDWLDGLDKSSFKELTRVSKGPDVDAMANGTFIGGVGLGMLAGAASVRENYDVAFKNKQGKRMVVRLYSTSAYQHLLTKVY